MLIHNADITGSLTINGVPYNTGSYTGIFKSGTNIISGNTVILTGSFTGSFLGDGSQLSGVTSYTDADTLDFINSLNVVSGSIQTVSTVSDTFTSATSYTVTHNFGTKQVIVSVYENDTLIFPSSITTPTTNTVTITFPEPVTGRAVVVKAGHIVSGSINYNSVLNKPTLVSGSSQITYSGLTGIPSGIVSGSSQISFTGITNKPTLISGSSQIAALGYATTGSNQFNGNQSITGSLTVSGQVVAQTLNIQQVTSSIVFSSGSNRFGNNTGNTHQFTGSVNISGSLTTSIATLGTAATTFLTSDSGTIKSRTAAQTLSDIGGQATGSYVTVATNQSITGQKTFTNNIDVNGVYVGRGASSGDLFGGISGNTAIGSQALLSISTGYPNTAVGAEALRNITTGANNIAVGSTAGKLISAGTANETSTTSIYIGNDTRPSANGNTNEIVIGHTTTGNGSNTVTIGNSSITNTYLKGAVTLTGALSGTTGSFTGAVNLATSTGNVGIGTTSADIFGRGDAKNVGISVAGASDNMALQLNAGGSAGRGAQIYMGQGGTRHLTISSNASETRAGTTTNTPFILTTNDTTRLTIASTGEATFSSKVTARNGTSGVAFETTNAVNADFTIETTSGGLTKIGTSGNILGINVGGGNVGIGTASPSGSLHLKGANGLTNFGTQILQVESSTDNYSGIVFSGTNGSNAAIRSEGASTMTFWTATGTSYTERMRINSSGVVLINNTYASPYGVLNTFKTPVASTYVDQIVVQSTGNYPSLRLGTYDAYDAVIATTGNDLRILAGLDVYTEDHNIRFYTSFIGGTGGAQAYERMRITSDGYMRMATGTGGIQFNGDTAAANALDDYEEGTWTPVVKIGTTTNTASATSGTYVKIGRVVYINATITGITKSSSGGLTITNLPFTVSATGGELQGSMRWDDITSSGFLSPYFGSGTTVIVIQNFSNTGYVDTIQDTAISSTYQLYGVTGFYYV